MDKEAQRLVEQQIRDKLGQGEPQEAIRVIMEGYGHEIFGYLLRSMRNEADAGDAFSQFCEDLCRGIGMFQGRSACKTWVYRLAISARAKLWDDPYRRRKERLATEEMLQLEQEARSRTLTYMKAEVKDRFARLREELDPDEQTLLVLRVDKDMSWPEIAEAMSKAEESLTEQELEARAAAWRQRFKRLKDRIRKIALADGLMEGH